MLKCIRKPKVRKQNPRAKVKTIHLQGYLAAVSEIANKRSRSQQCNQQPRSRWLFDEQNGKMRVTYQITDDGFIVIKRVYVLIDERWSCFYDQETARVGTFSSGFGKQLNYYYVDPGPETFDPFIELIFKIENKLEAKKLARSSPEIFERDEETALQVRHEEDVTPVPSWELENGDEED